MHLDFFFHRRKNTPCKFILPCSQVTSGVHYGIEPKGTFYLNVAIVICLIFIVLWYISVSEDITRDLVNINGSFYYITPDQVGVSTLSFNVSFQPNIPQKWFYFCNIDFSIRLRSWRDYSKGVAQKHKWGKKKNQNNA
jgi:hypothetical protein